MSNVLIVGEYSTLVDELIHKFSKENWRIYILVSKKKLIKPNKVFEQYVFDYDSNTMKDTLISCRPDVVIFTGAYDISYDWNGDRMEDTSIKYIAGLSNLLMSCSLVGINQFIYISSEDIYEHDYIIDITEDCKSSPRSYKGMAISQGENLALHFNHNTNIEVTIARIGGLYGIPINRNDCRGLVSNFCLTALETGRLEVNGKVEFSIIHVKDAVEGLYQLISAPKRQYHIYHISSGEITTEEVLANKIKDLSIRQVDIIDKTIGLRNRKLLSNDRMYHEFRFSTKQSQKESISNILLYMNSHKNMFFRERNHKVEGSFIKRASDIFVRVFPFIESILFFFPFYFIHNFQGAKQYTENINVFLLYVLLFAVMHGRQQAIFTSLLSVIGYSFPILYGSTGFSRLIDVGLYVWIAQIFIVGLTVGHLKDKFLEMVQDKEDKIHYLKEQLEDITKINSSNRMIKDYFQDKVISSTESVGKIYEITSALDKSEKGEVIFDALDIISKVMGATDISIYLVSNSGYCRLAASSSKLASSLGKSLRMNEYKEIFEPLKNNQVYINRGMKEGLPMMASSLLDKESNMRVVIFIWNIPYEKMTLYQSNLLIIVGSLIYLKLVRDADYIELLSYQRYVEDTKILCENSYNEIYQVYKKAQDKGYAEINVFHIIHEDRSLKELSDKIKPLLRETDYIGIKSNGDLVVLLTNTNGNESIYARKRLEEKGIRTYI